MNEAALFIWVRKSLQDILLAVKNVILNAMPFVFQHSHAKKKKNHLLSAARYLCTKVDTKS